MVLSRIYNLLLSECKNSLSIRFLNTQVGINENMTNTIVFVKHMVSCPRGLLSFVVQGVRRGVCC